MNKWIVRSLIVLNSYGLFLPKTQAAPDNFHETADWVASPDSDTVPGALDGVLDKEERELICKIAKEEFRKAGLRRPEVDFTATEDYMEVVHYDKGRPYVGVMPMNIDRMLHEAGVEAVRSVLAHEGGHKEAEQILLARIAERREQDPDYHVNIFEFNQDKEFLSDSLAAVRASPEGMIDALNFFKKMDIEFLENRLTSSAGGYCSHHQGDITIDIAKFEQKAGASEFRGNFTGELGAVEKAVVQHYIDSARRADPSITEVTVPVSAFSAMIYDIHSYNFQEFNDHPSDKARVARLEQMTDVSPGDMVPGASRVNKNTKDKQRQ